VAAPTDFEGNLIVAGQLYGLLGLARFLDSGSGDASLVHDQKPVSVNSGEAVRASRIVLLSGAQTLSNKTLDSTCQIAAAKGHRFWEQAHAYDPNAGLTSASVFAGIETFTYSIPIMRACNLVQVGVSAKHGSGSPPTDWSLEFYVNESGSPDETFLFLLNASAFANETTIGPPDGGPLGLTNGDRLGMLLTGSSLDAIAAQIALEFETT